MNWYYSGKATATSAFAAINIGFNAKNIIIQAASGNARDIEFSFLGSTVDGDLEAGEPLTIQPVNIRRLYIRGDGGNANYRIWAWAP